MLLWSTHSCKHGSVTKAAGVVSALRSVPVTGNPPVIPQIEPDCLGIIKGGWSTEPELYVCERGN